MAGSMLPHLSARFLPENSEMVCAFPLQEDEVEEEEGFVVPDGTFSDVRPTAVETDSLFISLRFDHSITQS